MSKRKYTHIKEAETQIIAMREAGMTRQEIADELGLEKVQIKAWVTRYNRRKNGLQQGIPSRPNGRPRKKPLSSAEEYEREISRLQISYIHTKEGVLYLPMIRDQYDNSIVAYKTASRQTVNLVLDAIRLAMKKEKKRVTAELQLHSDQGFQYTSTAYFKLASIDYC